MAEGSHGSDAKADVESVLGLDRSAGGRFLARWRGWAALAAVAAAGAIAYAVWGNGGGGAAVRYSLERATRSDLTIIVTATGSVQPTNRVDVSSELSGIVRKVLVDYNSRVRQGQPLAELDTDQLAATVDSMRAKVVAAEARVRDAQATIVQNRLDYERRQALVARSVTTQRDLEVARAAYERSVASLASARADVAAAKADLKLSETRLAKACICSPIDGIVLSRNVEPGQTVASTLQAPVLFSLAEDLTKMEVQVDVDEADVGKVAEGQGATFSVDAYPDRRFSARIRELRFGSEVVQGVVTYKAVLTTDNSDLLLRPGMTATAEITVQEVKDVLTVPNEALRFSPPATEPANNDGGLLRKLLPGRPRFRAPSRREEIGTSRTVWVMREGEPVAVPVTVGTTDGRRTQLLSGAIAAGQEVVVDMTAAKR